MSTTSSKNTPTAVKRMRAAGVALSLWFPRQWLLVIDYEHSRVRLLASGPNIDASVPIARMIVTP